jgi:hypothetical protein
MGRMCRNTKSRIMKLDRFLIILALQTLLEQVKDAEDQTYADRINKEITKLQNYEV